MKKHIAILSILVVLGIPSVAQSGNAGELTIEELYLQNSEIRLIREQAVTLDRDMKIIALENIEAMLFDGRLNTESSAQEAHYILDYLAGEGLTRVVRQNNRLVNYYPEVRRQAISLLGRLGGEDAKNSIVLILETEIEPMVLAEAAYALGTIGINENNEVSKRLAQAVMSQDAVGPDNNFAFASLLAYEKIAKANGGITDPLALEAIIKIAQGNYIRSVRLKAFEVLEQLRSY